MRIKRIVVALALSLNLSCGDPLKNDSEVVDHLAVRLDSFLPMKLNDDSVWVKDSQVQRMYRFTSNPKVEIAESFVLDDESARVIPHPSGNYVILASSHSAEIRTSSGQRVLLSPKLASKLDSIAFHFEAHTYALISNASSILLFKTTESGELLGTFLGGPYLADSFTFNQAEILNASTMIVVGSQASYAEVDLDATLESQKWVVSVHALPDDTIPHWVARISESEQKVLFRSATKKLILYNIQTKAIENESEYYSHRLLLQRWPQTFSWTHDRANDKHRFQYVDSDATLKAVDSTSMNISQHAEVLFVEKQGEILSVIVKENGFCRILRYRMSDFLLQVDQSFQGGVECSVLSDDKVFVNYDLGLGLVRTFQLSDGSKLSELSKFNLPL